MEVGFSGPDIMGYSLAGHPLRGGHVPDTPHAGAAGAAFEVPGTTNRLNILRP